MGWLDNNSELADDDAEMFYESLERTRHSRATSTACLSGSSTVSSVHMLSLLGRQSDAQDYMHEMVDILWELRHTANADPKNPIPPQLRSSIVSVSQVLSSLASRLSDKGVATPHAGPEVNKSFNSVESWRRGQSPHKVRKTDNPLGTYTKRSFKKALQEMEQLKLELAEHHQRMRELLKAVRQHKYDQQAMAAHDKQLEQKRRQQQESSATASAADAPLMDNIAP